MSEFWKEKFDLFFFINVTHLGRREGEALESIQTGKSWYWSRISMVLLRLNFDFTPSEAPGQPETDLGVQCPDEAFPVPWGFILVQKKNPQQEDA